jgi:PIN domain nuclease of toxin-antitoxin system
VVNLDTHMVVHLLDGKLTPTELQIVQTQPGSIAAIVLWELAKLVQLGRLTLDLHGGAFQAFLAGVRVWPLDLAVSLTSTRLDFRGDPADELIVATSIVHQVPLLTRDHAIRASKMVLLA